jgi:hypothetical protein
MSIQLNTAVELANLKVQRARLDVMAALMGYGPPADPRQQWEAGIAERTTRGMTRYQAIVDIGRTAPALWRAYNSQAR